VTSGLTFFVVVVNNLWKNLAIIQRCSSMNVMDDWKLKAAAVVRLEKPSETFVYISLLGVGDGTVRKSVGDFL